MAETDDIILRAAELEDADLVFRITKACMKDYAERTWGRFDEERTRLSFDPATHEIIQYKGRDIGCVERRRSANEVTLNKLYILPAYQNRGIGTAVMRHIMADAGSATPIQLTVLLINPARRFYERLGFVVTHSTSERHHMRWSGRHHVPENPK